MDWSTGEYHYHHGYPAHSHDGGICPYNFHDATDHSSHSNTSTSPPKHQSSDQQLSKWSIIEGAFAIGGIFSVIPFLIYLFVSSRFVRVSQNPHPLRMPAIYSFSGCVIAQYCKFAELPHMGTAYFMTFWMLGANLLYEYVLYAQAKAKYKKLYEGKDIRELAGIPDGIILLDLGIPCCADKATQEKYTIYVSKTNKYHRKSCKYSGLPQVCFYADVENLQPCKICKPEIPDITWYHKYKEIENIKSMYNIK